MTLAKNKIKREAFNEIGNRLDDLLEGLKEAKLKAEGAALAVGGLSPKIQALHEHVDKDVDEGVIKDLQVAKLVKLYITRSMNICEESARMAHDAHVKLEAKSTGIKASIFEVKKLFDKEEAAIQQAIFLAKCAEGAEGEQILDPTAAEPHRRQTGQRPLPSIKARRQAEEIKAQTEETQVPELSEPENVVPTEEKEEVPALPTPTPQDPLTEIKESQRAAVRADGRYQCGGCKRHFKSWDDLMEHCTLEEHVPRSPE